MNLNEFYTISFVNYRFSHTSLDLIYLLNTLDNDLSLRIYDNKKLLYRITIFHNRIMRVIKGDGDYIKFKSINIKKEKFGNLLKLLDKDDDLNYTLFLEILKQQLNENT